jgi:hypothetical protein
MPISRNKAEEPEVSASGLDEFKPRERVTKDVSDIPSFINRGSWAVGKSASGPKINLFKVDNPDEEVLIKFLEDVPFAPIYQHWILQDGKRRAYTCIVDECPLCARGDKAKASNWFNVIDMHGDQPELKVWAASPDPSKAIKNRADNKRTSPLNKNGLYFVVSKANGSNGIAEYSLDPVKEDELEDWGAKPITAEQIAKFTAEANDASVVNVKTMAELTQIAEQYLDND